MMWFEALVVIRSGGKKTIKFQSLNQKTATEYVRKKKYITGICWLRPIPSISL